MHYPGNCLVRGTKEGERLCVPNADGSRKRDENEPDLVLGTRFLIWSNA